jgi:uncharacterized membrane protein YfcA
MEWTWSIFALPFTLLFIGVLIGLILGLTGSGGSLVAVPLLVVLLSLELSEAIGISLAVVAFSAVIGVFHHLKLGSIVWLPTIVFAVVGSALTPLGYQLGQYFTPLLITVFFSVLTSVIAIVMWKKTHSNNTVLRANTLLTQADNTNEVDAFPLTMTWKTIGATMIAAALTGVLSGLLGVGGGFIIVPALTLLLKMNMRQAVASSLVIISIVSSVGFYQYLVLTPIINTHFMSYLMSGSAVGMGLGIFLSRYVTGQKLQKIFAITMVVMAFVMLLKNSG